MRVFLDSWAERCLPKDQRRCQFKKALVLKYFSEGDLTEDQGDDSKVMLSFLLMQHIQPVTSCDGALPLAMRTYSQIEKESLAPVLGMKRNHQYVFVKKVILQTDQKPLIVFMQEPVASAPKRLERTFVATEAVSLRDTLLAYERYATSRHSFKNLHEDCELYFTEVEIKRTYAKHFLSVPNHQFKQI